MFRLKVAEKPNVYMDYALYEGTAVPDVNMNRLRLAYFTPGLIEVYIVNPKGFYMWKGNNLNGVDGRGWKKYDGSDWHGNIPWDEDEWLTMGSGLW